MNRFCKTFEQDSWAPLGIGGAPARADEAFSWGYADLLGPDRSGVVVIWAWAMPFVPGTLARERAGDPHVARETPSICIAAYDRGHPAFYLLESLDPTAVEGDRFGGITVHRAEGTLALSFDVAVPGGSRLEGRFAITGTEVRASPLGPSVHRWAPQLVGKGHAELRSGSWSMRVEGRAYHDRNASALGLSRLGIRRWIWGRTPHPDGEWVHYLLEPEADRPEQNHVLFVGWDGEVEHTLVEARRQADAAGRWGLRAPRTFTAGPLGIEHVHAFEDGPFYQRWQTRVTMPDGRVGDGVGEVVSVDDMDRGWLGPLVRMAVVDGPRSSMWVPLFAGPSTDRVRRLFRYWAGR